MALIELVGIDKEFSGVKVLRQVSLALEPGEVHALVGENGAGKSTLMNILSGTYPAGSYGGQIRSQLRSQLRNQTSSLPIADDKLLEFRSPADAEEAGVAIIHQELSGFGHLSVAENLCVGHWPQTTLGLVDAEKMHANADEWLKRVGATFSSQTKLSELSTGGQQLVEIAKALSRDSQVLILDEPTSSLTPVEVERLFALLRRLRAERRALVYISHKMEEIFAIADRVTVLRDGQSVFTGVIGDVDKSQLIHHMVGRSLDRIFPERPVPQANAKAEAKDLSSPAHPLLEVKDLCAKARVGHRQIGPVSFALRSGEILGFAGLLGAGRSEIALALMGGLNSGATKDYEITGEMKLRGKHIKFTSPRAALKSHLALVGEDRKRDSILPQRSLNENAAVSRLSIGKMANIFSAKPEAERSTRALEQMHTRYQSVQQKITELSGGNQQKVIFARVLELSPDVLLLDEPTRGVDVGAKYEIYQTLFALAMQGKALIVISSDLLELMALADRIMVVSEGRITGELARGHFQQSEIMRLAIQGRVVEAKQ